MTWFFKKGELAKDNWDVLVDGSIKGWQHTGLRVGTLGAGRQFHIIADGLERLIFPLEGVGLTVEYRLAGETAFQTQFLRGRKSVFHGTSDLIYLPVDTEIKIHGEGRVCIGEAPAKNSKAVKFIAAEEVPVFVRGAGRESRQVHNFGVPEHLDADRFIVVEVIVPAGNWSGIPAHKHDTYIPGVESNLEEIYYFETAVTRGVTPPAASDAIGYLRGYASDEREYDLLEEVRSGDVGLVPHGWHGPAMASPGYDLYFFNVMAGPDPDRSWNITDDPNHAWIRETWHHQDPDPRLPYTA
ncbi:5-deoxy-glucuronate isomerase [Rhodoluna sp. KAS3]|uniref:5-deoxy-glucuronate isomerase n=1 Tax=Rhodoluna sp. KAS3 TaxID=942880 RepID=UPI00222E3521|nr:5-deoxy-glucuronate isomerase [Rhodoluna sp. KAS3]BDS49331.1 5-deoxy-glucuronate isomerase [Rhodoluna sp. KAS3]